MLRASYLGILLIVLYAHLSYAKIEVLDTNNDKRSFFHISSFGYLDNGVFQLDMKDLSLWMPATTEKKEAYPIAFLIQRANPPYNDPVSMDSSSNQEGVCMHDILKGEDDVLLSVASRRLWEHYKVERKMPNGYYHLYFSNCVPGSMTSFKLVTTQYNIDSNGVKNYLSVGEMPLPSLYFYICITFCVVLAFCSYFMIRHKELVKYIHYMMFAVLFFKTFSLLFDSFKYYSLQNYGVTKGWHILYYIFNFLRGMLFFTVVILIGTGWSYMKAYLTDRDRHFIYVILGLQLLFNISAVILAEASPGSSGWLTWRDIMYILDMICCCIILFPIVWSIKHLKQAAEVDGKINVNVMQLQRFRWLYLAIVSYVYFTRIIIFLMEATLPPPYFYLTSAFSEIVTLLFYLILSWLFRPQSANPYLPLSTDIDEEDRLLDEIASDSHDHNSP